MQTIQKLKKIQEYSNKSQTELAALLGVSFPTFNSWINGRSSPRRGALERIESLYTSFVGDLATDESVLASRQERLADLRARFPKPLEVLLARRDLYDEFVLKMTYNTNSIEGSTFNEPEVRAVLFDDVTVPDKSVREHQEVKNHQGALGFALRYMRDEGTEITEGLVRRLHAILMNGILHNAGEYRAHSVRIAGSNVPTSNYSSISNHLRDFVIDLNGGDDSPGHIAKMHSDFEKIHPFSDGNGRIGRLIMMMQSFRAGDAPALVEQEKRIAYYRYLQESQLHGNYIPLTSFVYDAMFVGYALLD